MSKRISYGISAIIISYILCFTEILMRYILDNYDIGGRAPYAVWDSYQPQLKTIIYISLIEFFTKGWIYLILTLFHIFWVQPRILTDRLNKVIVPILLIMPMMIWDIIKFSRRESFIYDGLVSYLVVGIVFALITSKLRTRSTEGNKP